jgi:hypothetical protein
MRAYLLVRGATEGITEYREEALLPLHTIAVGGPVSRGDFIRMTGLEERTARKVISRFTKDGLLTSDGHRSELRIGFPLGALNILFPNLYPEAATAVLE